MGRKKGFNREKIISILSALARNPDGLWLRRLAEEAGVAPATAAHYVETVLESLVEDDSLGNSKKPIMRVIKLKPFVLERLQEGLDISQIMRMMRLIDEVE